MKNFLALFLLLFCIPAIAQSEGQSFCDGTNDGNYFPLIVKKKLLWSDTWYLEEYKGEITLNGKTYKAFRQTWENGSLSHLYLREEDGKVLQYEACCETETVRYDQFFEPGHTWQSEKKDVTYTMLSYHAELQTPYCNYTNLMAVEAQYEKVTFIFYYQKGYGYVGAKNKDKVMSCATPEW
jgi:hypothetical protein